MTVRVQWDLRKAELNLRKHGVSFQTAVGVFGDPFALTEQDRVEDGEYRWRTIGLVGGVYVLVVAHTIKDDDDGVEIYRIISARAAEPRERRAYERGKAGHL
jgi:uncharacterized DUF497 family protein